MEVSGKRGRSRDKDKAEIAGEVSGRQGENQSATKTGSDEQPPLCRVCERTGEITDANAFCIECNDHLCGNCARSHRGSRTSSRHQLLDKSQMPRKAFKARHMCVIHPDSLIEYYCNIQDQLLCRHCLALNHQGCQGDDLISDICGHGKEFRKTYKRLKEIEPNITEQESKRKSNLAAINANQQNIKRDIESFKKELHMFVERLADDMFKEVEDLVDRDNDTMAAVSEECDNMAAEVKDLITEIDIKKQSNEKMQLFIVMKTAQQALEMLGYKMKSIDAQNHAKKYSFEPHKQLQDVMRSVRKLGQMSVDEEKPVQTAAAGRIVTQRPKVDVERTVANKAGELSEKGKRDKLDRRVAAADRVVTQRPEGEPEWTVANNTGELAAKGTRDARDCCITGIELLDDDRIAVVDHNNFSVKMLSLSQKRVTHELPLPYAAWDITKIDNDELAVTCRDGECIQLVSVSRWFGSLSLGQQIRVGGSCRGLQYSGAGGGRMIVTFVQPAKVQIIDMSGTVYRQLSSDTEGTPLFSTPKYVAFSPDGHCVYVSDWSNHTVTGMTLDGRVVFSYRDDKLERPTRLTVGEDGVIYVCGESSNNIHMISSEGKKIKILMGEKMRRPQSIMYNSTDHKLYVAMLNSVFVFSLTR